MSDGGSDDADDDEEVCACSSCERGALVVLVALLFACAHSLRAAPTARKHSPTSPAVDTLPSATQGMLCDGELDLHKRSTPTRHAWGRMGPICQSGDNSALRGLGILLGSLGELLGGCAKPIATTKSWERAPTRIKTG